MQGRGVRRKRAAGAAKQAVQGLVVHFAHNVPQADVDHADTGHVVVAEAAFQVVVDLLPGSHVFPDEVLGAMATCSRVGPPAIGYSPVMP